MSFRVTRSMLAIGLVLGCVLAPAAAQEQEAAKPQASLSSVLNLPTLDRLTKPIRPAEFQQRLRRSHAFRLTRGQNQAGDAHFSSARSDSSAKMDMDRSRQPDCGLLRCDFQRWCGWQPLQD